MRVVSLFCGIGGLDKGFVDAGYKIIWANDFDKYAVATYNANFSTHATLADITTFPLDEIPEFDVLIGGFPCQPFSMMGQQKGFEDTRGTLFFRIAEIIDYQIKVRKHKPRAIILENVRALRTHDKGHTFARIKEILSNDLGYQVFDMNLNSADYGVPQTRNRTYIVCFANKNIKEFSEPPKVKLRYHLKDLLENNVPDKYFLSDKIKKTILSDGTGGWKARAETDLPVARPLCATMGKMHRASQDNYVTQEKGLRRLTPRECARLQGFDGPQESNYIIPVSDAQAYKQFGNAVTVNVARAVANEVREKLTEVGEWTDDNQNDINGKRKGGNVRYAEVEEMLQFIRAFQLPGAESDAKICIDRVTAPIDEEFLMQRASEVLQSVAQDKRTVEGFRNLATICNGNKRLCSQCPICKYCNTYIKEVRSEADRNSLKMVDLFCGSGGLSLGFTQEGFTTVLANDIQEVCVDTYAHNHPETPRNRIILGDIKEKVVDHLDELLEDVAVDIVVGGPPCQGFSMANRQRLIDDPRNKLYKYFVQTVEKVKPPFFVMENVKGMLSVKDQVIEDFEKIGYNVVAHILNAKNFGVPQNRERLIYIGNRVGEDNEQVFREIEELSRKIPDHVLSDALFGLRALKASTRKNSTDLDTEESGRKIDHDYIQKQNEYISYINQGRHYPAVLNHKARYNNDRDIEIFRRLNPGDKSTDPKIADIMPYSRRNGIFKDKYFKLEPDKVCKTITAHMKFDCNMYIHPYQARGLTPREAARVQSYPDDYFFRGAYTKTYMQIGNSVPPLLGRAIATVLKKYIEKYSNNV